MVTNYDLTIGRNNNKPILEGLVIIQKIVTFETPTREVFNLHFVVRLSLINREVEPVSSRQWQLTR